VSNLETSRVTIKVVGVGGAGGNALQRMSRHGIEGVEFLAANTDIQALRRLEGMNTFAIGPTTTGGVGSGGHPEIGRKAIKESQEQVSQLLERTDMVFVAAGMGGGTGSGAAPVIGEIARRQGALTVGVVTMPFSFEGPQRRDTAKAALLRLQQKVDTLIVVENDRLLPSVDQGFSLEKAFELADEALVQGVRGIAEIVAVTGLINVDFADVKTLMTKGGPSFMSMGEAKGKEASKNAAEMALSNPLFDAPIEGANGILLSIKGGNDLSLLEVHEAVEIIRGATGSGANMIFGLVQERSFKSRVSLTLIATGIRKRVPFDDRVEWPNSIEIERESNGLAWTAGAFPKNGSRSLGLTN